MTKFTEEFTALLDGIDHDASVGRRWRTDDMGRVVAMGREAIRTIERLERSQNESVCRYAENGSAPHE